MVGKRRMVRKKNRKSKKLATIGTVKRLISRTVEHKFDDYEYSASVSSSGTFLDCTAPIQGDGDFAERIGDQILLTSCHVHLLIAAADTYQRVRVCFFQWHPNTSLSVPTQGILFQDISSANAVVTSFWENDRKDQFTVLYDKTFSMVLTQDSALVGRKFKLNLKKARKKVQFYNSGVDASNKIYMFATSDSSAASHPAVYAQIRLRYMDA